MSDGAEEVVEGLDQALLKMKEGEEAEISIAPQYGFGSEGCSSMEAPVPPDATLLYTVELLSIQKVLRTTYPSDSPLHINALVYTQPFGDGQNVLHHLFCPSPSLHLQE